MRWLLLPACLAAAACAASLPREAARLPPESGDAGDRSAMVSGTVLSCAGCDVDPDEAARRACAARGLGAVITGTAPAADGSIKTHYRCE
jgi:hypothetical protein